MEKRYKRTGYNYPAYYLVVCPKCKKDATVSVVGDGWITEGYSVKCSHCTYQARRNNLIYDVEVKRNCPDCGKEFCFRLKNIRKPLSRLDVTCPKCGFKAEYSTRTMSFILVENLNGLKGDPHFKHQLKLQTEVKGKLFWAYNHEHLTEIKAFVEADLRERQSTYLMTMTARLPEFIKTAKNRQEILKAIDQLQQRK